MKKITFTLLLIVCSVAAGYSQLTFLADNTAYTDNEFEQHALGADADFYGNPLLLNGKPLAMKDHTLDIKDAAGMLTLVEGDPASRNTKEIRFSAYIRRKGVILNVLVIQASYQINLRCVLLMAEARVGDELIIQPFKKEYWKAKRIIKLVGYDGC